MTIHKTEDYLISLINELRKSAKETEWVEFKHNNADPDEIGQQIASLSNSAALCDKAYAYLVWGIQDKTHQVVGTSFSFSTAKVGNEELEHWLLKLLEPKIHFRFFEFKMDDLPIVLLEIPRAFHHPVCFKGEKLIKVGSYTKKLKDFPEKERKLWHYFDNTPFENGISAENLSNEEVLRLLDYPTYFELLNQPLPVNQSYILDAFQADNMVTRSEVNKWNISNLGAILFARKISAFSSLKRKMIRIILYKNNDRTDTLKEYELEKGYANGFEELMKWINTILPSHEVIEEPLRKSISLFPTLAVRELVANAIIHQDFFITGSAPMIEIFKNRMEITNPGKPLIEISRFLDSPPRSRNEALASFMRRIGICEERGSGIDKVIQETEIYQLPAPIFEAVENNTRVVLFVHKPMSKMDKHDRTLACYLHACLKYVSRDYMTNSSLRDRFGIEPQNSAIASRIIKDTLNAELIRPYDSGTLSRKHIKYVPFWAQ